MLNIFNSKYRRSEWMEGVLLAELYAKSADSVGVETGTFDYAFGPEPYTVLVAENERATVRYPLNGDDFEKGVRDYLDFIKNNS